ncbi:MAG: hypothetical protein AAF202_05875, partial [Pseudomonadota bacterium]
QVTDNGSDPIATPGFELYNLYMTRRFVLWGSLSQMRFRVNNIADTFYRRHGTPLIGQSRDFRLELSVAL